MNKKYEDFIKEYSLTIQDKSAIGFIDGYQVSTTVDQFARLACVGKVSIFLDANQQNTFSDFMRNHKKEFGFVQVLIDSTGVHFASMCFTLNKGIDNLKKTILGIIEKAKELSLPTNTCPLCGKELLEKDIIIYNDMLMYVDQECSNNLEKVHEEKEKEYQALPNNYGKAFLGALVGALIGGIVWFLIGILLNLVSGYVAFLISFLAGFGYDKLKGKPNYKKVLFTSIVSFLAILLAEFGIYYVYTLTAMKEVGLSGSVIQVFIELLKDTSTGVLTSFILDLVLALVFGAIGIFYSNRQMIKNLHK